jgi:predicted nucleotidyltransferase
MDTLERLGIDPERIAEFCRKWKIVRLEVFGSAARGEMRPDSDIDFMATFAPEAPWGLWEFVDMRDELREIVGRNADLVETGAIRNPYRLRSIERDLTQVYAA